MSNNYLPLNVCEVIGSFHFPVGHNVKFQYTLYCFYFKAFLTVKFCVDFQRRPLSRFGWNSITVRGVGCEKSNVLKTRKCTA